ncbi:hypothetical protein NARC_60006 [Candidatus Nitrosocosmicus arcticus]|uniref:Uncharacterized protein n=1 Tax=Candidatus Nitrosocosmicus arcticus TaxID=2035267 RepID=A0A557SVH9_9ARCH|nr:hypothetical protein NARC_60006 [Candidatus Nitrosocosmicus arcticus]
MQNVARIASIYVLRLFLRIPYPKFWFDGNGSSEIGIIKIDKMVHEIVQNSLQ